MSIPTEGAGFLACLKFDNPLQLIVSRLIFRKSRFVAHRWNGLQFIAEFPGQKIDLLKMDIEGCEWGVLETGQCERLRDCHHLLIEVHPHSGRGITDFQKAVKPYGLELREVRNAAAEDVFLFSQNAIASSESGANH